MYETSAISTVVTVSPVNGTSSWKSARLGNRVEEVGDEADRRVEQAIAEADERERGREHEADADGDQRELDVLDERRLQRVAQCARTHSVQNQPLCVSQWLPCPKFGITGPPASTRFTRAARPS